MGLIASMPMDDWPARHAEVDIGWAASIPARCTGQPGAAAASTAPAGPPALGRPRRDTIVITTDYSGSASNPHSRDGRSQSLRQCEGQMALGDADLGLSPPACASVCAGQSLRCTISPSLHKGIWLSGPRAYLPCGLLFGSSYRSGAPDATNKQVFASWIQNGTALHQVAQTAASTDFLPRFLPKRAAQRS